MAATAIYASITRIPLSGVPTENVSYDNIAATTAAFVLTGGRYAISVKASTFGSVTLQMLGPDDTTYLTAATAIAADGMATGLELPPGFYRLLVA